MICGMSRFHESTRREDDLGSWRGELVGDETNRTNSRRDDQGEVDGANSVYNRTNWNNDLKSLKANLLRICFEFITNY